ncbi:hypothetical protein HID58_093355, partial [Brassica napus]
MSHLLRRLKLSLRRNLTTSSRFLSSSPIYYYVRGAESWEPVPTEGDRMIGVPGGSTFESDLDLPDTDPKRIPLPPFVTLPRCMPNPNRNQHCIVAVKFLGPQLSLCRPAQRDCKWSNIRITDPSFFSSHVMYSKRDGMPLHRIMGSGRHIKEPKIQMLRLPDEDPIPEMTEKKWQRLESCCTKATLLSGVVTHDETFMVKRSHPITNNLWDHFLVLKIDKEGNAVYTKTLDISAFYSPSLKICIPSKSNRKHEFAIVMISTNQKFGKCNADLHVGLSFGSLNLGGIVNYKKKKRKERKKELTSDSDGYQWSSFKGNAKSSSLTRRVCLALASM